MAYSDFTTTAAFGFGDAALATDTCCGGPITVTFTLLVRSPEESPACPAPVMGRAGPVLRAVGSATLVAAPAPPPGPPCRHRGDEMRTGDVARAGLSTSRRWYACGKAGFERYGLPVSDCRTCGLPPAQQCGSGRCDGYEPGDPD